MNYKFLKCNFTDIKEMVKKYAGSLSSPIDSFLEEHILKSEHYLILINENEIGYFSIYNKELLTQFYLKEEYRSQGQRMFSEVRKMEHIQSAFVPTCDEFFMAHSLDNYKSLDKQAYFFQDSRTMYEEKSYNSISLRTAKLSDIDMIKDKSGDFFDRLEERIPNEEIYIAERNGDVVGFGIMERGIIIKGYASIGMFVVENARQQGVGANIIMLLRKETYNKGLKPIAGCWYYNHFSKKTLEKAGLYSNTRLLKINY